MSELVALAYPSDSIAPAVVDRLERLASENDIDVEDLVVVTCRRDGSTKVDHPLSKTGSAATLGGVCGLIAGFMLLNPLAGAAVGAGAGALSAKLRDSGIDADFARELTEELQPGTSAVLVLVRNVNRERVVPEMARFRGRVLYTSLGADAEQRLRDAIEGQQPSPATPADQV
jgi:uncharacterized membrane protein